MSWRKAITSASSELSSPFDLRLHPLVLRSACTHVREGLEGAYAGKAELQDEVAEKFWKVVGPARTLEDFGDLSTTVMRNGLPVAVGRGVQKGLQAMHETFGVLAGLDIKSPLPLKVAKVVARECEIKTTASLYENPAHFDLLRRNTVQLLRDSRVWPQHLLPVSYRVISYAKATGNLMDFRQRIEMLDLNLNPPAGSRKRIPVAEARYLRHLREGVQFAFDSLCQSTGLGAPRSAHPLTSRVAAEAWRLTHAENRPFKQNISAVPRSN